MKIEKIALLVLFIIAGTIPLAKSEPEELKVIEGNHIIVKIPEEYLKEVESQLPYYDKMYEFFYELVGDVPYGGGKIEILYVPGGGAIAGNPIIVGESIWERLKKKPTETYQWEVNATIAHELGHDFTLDVTSLPTSLLIPVQGFAEGWAEFLEHYIAYRLGAKEVYEMYRKASQEIPELYYKEYGAKNFTSLPKLEKACAGYVKAVLQFYVDRYGWDALKRFFELLREVRNSEFLNIRYGAYGSALSVFVYYLGIAANDVEGVYELFKEFGFPVERMHVVKVRVIDLPPSVKTELRKGLSNYGKISGEEERLFLFQEGEKCRFAVTSPILFKQGIRYVAKNDTIYCTVPCPEIIFQFVPQYYLEYENLSGWYEEGEKILIETENIINLSNKTRLIFKGFLVNGELINNSLIELNIDRPLNITKVFKKQYYINVTTEYGEVEGIGWYDEGSVASVKIQPTEILISEDFFIRKIVRLKNWQEEIKVDKPKEITAEWQEEVEAKWLAILTVLTALIISLVVTTILMRKFKF